jgi:hypothetical protein
LELEGCTTLAAKLHLLRIVKATAWATHACIPSSTLSASFLEALIVTRRTSTVGMVWLLWLVVGGAARLRRQGIRRRGVRPNCRQRGAEQSSDAGMSFHTGSGSRRVRSWA